MQAIFKHKQALVIFLAGIALSALIGLPARLSGTTVTASVETDPVATKGDSADDPAVWVHPTDSSQSTIIGTDKETSGLLVYGLDGRQLQYVRMTGVNNVDLRYDFPLGNERVALVVASNPVRRSFEVFRVEANSRQLSPVTAYNNQSNAEVWGVCMYNSRSTGRYYVFNVRSDGQIEQWEISGVGDSVELNRVRLLSVQSKSEGCVADDYNGSLYVAEEARGIWRFEAEPDTGGKGKLIDSTDWKSGHVRADVEGLAIYDAGQGRGYLIASSQGDNSYVIYDRLSNAHVGKFKIRSGSIDGVSETDGIEVVGRALGPKFPKGVFVAQDGENFEAHILKRHQNFKLVRWEEIASQFLPNLSTP